MLKFLTQKLRTHSISEESVAEKADEEERDSGTESDEEVEADVPSAPATMERMSNVSPADTGCSMESPAPDPDPHDPHSSEEELEVINRTRPTVHAIENHRAASVCLPEKRKWSQVARRGSPHEESRSLSPASSSSYDKTYGEDVVLVHEHSGSSDDEVHALLESMATPVLQFRTSPPLEAVKPGGPGGGGGIGCSRLAANHRHRAAVSPPPKLVHYEVSPRKRSRHARHLHQRPCLDFEKMQQLKARSVTPWKNSNDHGGELSVFCW